jgi:hypothetical protein
MDPLHPQDKEVKRTLYDNSGVPFSTGLVYPATSIDGDEVVRRRVAGVYRRFDFVAERREIMRRRVSQGAGGMTVLLVLTEIAVMLLVLALLGWF